MGMLVSRLGTALVVLGLLAIAYGALWQLGVVPGSRVTLPAPVALERAAPGAREVSAPVVPSLAPTSTPVPTAAAVAPTAEVTRPATPVPQPLSVAPPAPSPGVP